MKLTILGTPDLPPIPLRLPLYSSRVRAGFPSPADDYIQKTLDLNEYLIKRPASTFFVRAEGLSMVEFGIQDGALLIVDKAVAAAHGRIIIASVDGQLTCKKLDEHAKALVSSKGFAPIHISEGSELLSFGVVMHVVNTFCTQ